MSTAISSSTVASITPCTHSADSSPMPTHATAAAYLWTAGRTGGSGARSAKLPSIWLPPIVPGRFLRGTSEYPSFHLRAASARWVVKTRTDAWEVVMTRPRILLADDHAMLLEAFKALLEPEFDVVGTVTDGRMLRGSVRAAASRHRGARHRDAAAERARCRAAAQGAAQVGQADLPDDESRSGSGRGGAAARGVGIRAEELGGSRTAAGDS